jgi:hypothetical protein
MAVARATLVLHSLHSRSGIESGLLSQRVNIDSMEHFREEVFRGSRISFALYNATVECCPFIGLKSPNNSGAAMMLFGARALINLTPIQSIAFYSCSSLESITIHRHRHLHRHLHLLFLRVLRRQRNFGDPRILKSPILNVR